MSPSTEHDNVFALHNPEQQFVDPIMELLRQHARTLISKAVEAEVTHFIEQYEDLVLDNGRKRVVRNGFTPERTVQTPVGPVQVKTPRVRDRGNTIDPIHFHSNILPPYLRKTRTLEELVPWLYLKGISTGQMEDTWNGCCGVLTEYGQSFERELWSAWPKTRKHCFASTAFQQLIGGISGRQT